MNNLRTSRGHRKSERGGTFIALEFYNSSYPSKQQAAIAASCISSKLHISSPCRP